MSGVNIDRAVAQAVERGEIRVPSVKNKVVVGKPTAGAEALLPARTVTQAHATLDTGDMLYDKYPKIPSASDSGRQDGVPPMAERRMRAHYEAVDLGTATARAAARQSGRAAIIAGGLDDLEGTKRVKDLSEPVGASLDAQDNPESTAPAPAVFDVPKATQQEFRPAFPHEQAAQVMVQERIQMAVAPQTKRVSLTFANGVYSMPCVDVKEGANGIMIVLRLDPNSATFLPAPGTRFSVGMGNKSWQCFYPGLCFELPECGLQVMSLLLDQEKTNDGKA